MKYLTEEVGHLTVTGEWRCPVCGVYVGNLHLHMEQEHD